MLIHVLDKQDINPLTVADQLYITILQPYVNDVRVAGPVIN